MRAGYDVPGVIAVRLPNSIATCDCGEWLSGSKAALLARLMNPDDIKEIDLKPYKVARTTSLRLSSVDLHEAVTQGRPRSIRVIARGAKESVNTVFTIGLHPLWIGRAGCHVELAESESVDPALLDLAPRKRLWSCAMPIRTWARFSTASRSTRP